MDHPVGPTNAMNIIPNIFRAFLIASLFPFFVDCLASLAGTSHYNWGFLRCCSFGGRFWRNLVKARAAAGGGFPGPEAFCRLERAVAHELVNQLDDRAGNRSQQAQGMVEGQVLFNDVSNADGKLLLGGWPRAQ
jgi:hypothetical protein